MVVKLIVIQTLVKEAFEKSLSFVKKYWQFFLGLCAGLFVLVLTRDKGNMRKAFEETARINREARDKNLEILKEKSEKVSEAIEDFTEREMALEVERQEKEREIASRAEEIKNDLLEREEKSPGTIASEINKIVK